MPSVAPRPRNHPHVNFGIRGADAAFARVGGTVARGVEGDAKDAQARADSLADRIGMLADSAAEDDRVGASQHRQIRSDILARAVAKDVYGQAARWSPRAAAASISRRSEEIPETPNKPDLVFKSSSTASAESPSRAARKADDRGIDVTRAGDHHQSLKRRQTHRGVHRASLGDRGNRASRAELKRNQIQLAAPVCRIIRRSAPSCGNGRCRGIRNAGCHGARRAPLESRR